ncbi:MAG TPA: M55 family metallopeptidase [Candidatus Limnocylindria bacterium]
MRLYLSVDMEGLAGIAHPAQTYFDREGVADRTDYDRGRMLMAGEANAAIGAALEAGMEQVIVNDSHWQMRNLRAEDLDPRARLIVGDKPFSMTQGIGTEGDGLGFAAAAFVGYHAGAGHPSGIIGHTYSGAVVMEVRVNGVPHNEAGLNALRLGQHGVPVVLVTGDDALAGEIELLLPWAERVVVKRAQAAYVAEADSPELARRAIAEGLGRALARLDQMPLYHLPELRLEVDVRLPIMADYCALIPGVERIGPRSVAAEPADAEALFGTFMSIVRMAQVPG